MTSVESTLLYLQESYDTPCEHTNNAYLIALKQCAHCYLYSALIHKD